MVKIRVIKNKIHEISRKEEMEIDKLNYKK